MLELCNVESKDPKTEVTDMQLFVYSDDTFIYHNPVPRCDG